MPYFLTANLRFLAELAAVGLIAVLIFRFRAGRRHGLSMPQRNLAATNFAFFTTLYTFFMGFAVMTLWQNYNTTDTNVTLETDLLVVEYRLSHNLPGTERLRGLLERYVVEVADDEWPAMSRGETSAKAAATYEAIWVEASRLKPVTLSEQNFHAILLNKLIDLNRIRHERLLQVSGNLYYPLWIVLYLGVVFTLGSFYFIDVDHRYCDWFFVVMILAMVMANLYLVIEMDKPFSGAIHLEPDRFRQALATMRAIAAVQ